jgi:beta-glucosidase
MKKFYVLCLFSCSVFSLFSQPKTTKSPAKVKPPKVVEVQMELESWESLGPILREEVKGSIGYVDQGQDFRTDSAIGITMIRKSPKAELNLPEFKNKSGDVDLEVYKKVKSLEVRQLVGQMTQIDLALICEGDVCALKSPQTLVAQKLKTAFETYSVGSVLNVGCGSGTISRELWIEIQKGIQQANLDYNSHKIPVIYGIDAIHGANYTKGATLFPQQIGQAAMWNPGLIQKAAEITAYDVRASGIHWNFSPVLDLGRQPLWSRFFETYGEDVLLAEACTRAAILGYQNNQPEFRVAACMKHFLGYSYPLSGKDRTPAWIDNRTMREYYLPTFQEAIRSGALTTMINSGELNGEAVHTNYDILTKLLREELGFGGIAVTDWEDIYKLHHTHKVAPTLKEAVYMSITAGIDMSMTPSDFKFNDLLIELVNEGRISKERLQQSVYRILLVKKALGLWEKPVFDADNNQLFPPFDLSQYDKSYPLLGSKEHSDIALEAALESITLLKNNAETLPLKSDAKIFVAGNAANDLTLLNGAWSHTWQGGDTNAYQTPNKPTFFEGISQVFGTKQVSLGFPKKIKKDEVLVYCIGEKPATEIPGDITDLKFEIPEKDLQFLQQRKRKGAKTILVLTLARPRIITHIDTLCDAVIHTYLPGDEGGKALAQIISGQVVPSGKLPFTYPRAAGDIVHYDRKPTEDNDTKFGKNAYNPLYDFGHGLSYSQFKYSDLKVVFSQGDGDYIGLSVMVTNTGKQSAKEVIQVYFRDEYASITPSVKKLCAFEKVEIGAGQSYTYTFTWIPLKALSFINKDGVRVVEDGDFTIMVKDLQQKINLKNGWRFSSKD